MQVERVFTSNQHEGIGTNTLYHEWKLDRERAVGDIDYIKGYEQWIYDHGDAWALYQLERREARLHNKQQDLAMLRSPFEDIPVVIDSEEDLKQYYDQSNVREHITRRGNEYKEVLDIDYLGQLPTVILKPMETNGQAASRSLDTLLDLRKKGWIAVWTNIAGSGRIIAKPPPARNPYEAEEHARGILNELSELSAYYVPGLGAPKMMDGEGNMDEDSSFVIYSRPTIDGKTSFDMGDTTVVAAARVVARFDNNRRKLGTKIPPEKILCFAMADDTVTEVQGDRIKIQKKGLEYYSLSFPEFANLFTSLSQAEFSHIAGKMNYKLERPAPQEQGQTQPVENTQKETKTVTEELNVGGMISEDIDIKQSGRFYKKASVQQLKLAMADSISLLRAQKDAEDIRMRRYIQEFGASLPPEVIMQAHEFPYVCLWESSQKLYPDVFQVERIDPAVDTPEEMMGKLTRNRNLRRFYNEQTALEVEAIKAIMLARHKIGYQVTSIRLPGAPDDVRATHYRLFLQDVRFMDEDDSQWFNAQIERAAQIYKDREELGFPAVVVDDDMLNQLFIQPAKKTDDGVGK